MKSINKFFNGQKKEYRMIQFERCFIMLCNNLTEQECINRNLFGDKGKRLEYYDDVQPGDIGFLLNVDKDELLGIFRACSKAQLHIEPDAWNGRFAAQVRVELTGKLQRLKDAAYILNKAGVSMSQLKSSGLAPRFPVHSKEVGEKIVKYFKEENE